MKTLDTQNNSFTSTYRMKKHGRPINGLLDGYNHEAETGNKLAR